MYLYVRRPTERGGTVGPTGIFIGLPCDPRGGGGAGGKGGCEEEEEGRGGERGVREESEGESGLEGEFGEGFFLLGFFLRLRGPERVCVCVGWVCVGRGH